MSGRRRTSWGPTWQAASRAADLDWSDQAEKQAFLGMLAEDARKVVKLAAKRRKSLESGGAEEERIVKATEILNQVRVQDVEAVTTAEDGTPKGRGKNIRQGTGGDRICSVTDPQMRHGRKTAHHRFDGDKMALATDVDSQLIVAVEVWKEVRQTRRAAWSWPAGCGQYRARA